MTRAEYRLVRKNKNGKIEHLLFISKYISTIDIPYGNYILK